MDKNKRLVKKGVEILFLATMAGALIAGCGGGGGGGAAAPSGSPSGASGAPTIPSASSTPVGSYIADGQGASFDGFWTNTNTVGSTASATASTITLGATASSTVFNINRAPKSLSGGGVWSNTGLAAATGLTLTPTGWAAATNNATFVDGGDGIHASVVYQNGAVVASTFAKNNLTGAITCRTPAGAATACVAPASYPAGAAQYVMTRTLGTYSLISAPTTYAVTDATGALMTSLPAVGATFCDPVPPATVYQSIIGSSYRAFSSVGCTGAQITAALGTASIGTVTISAQTTGNLVVPSVLVLSGASVGAPAWFNNSIYALNAGNVWYGTTAPAGTYGAWNKIAVNAELAATGYAQIP